MSIARPGDQVLLVSPERKRYLIRLQEGASWFSHRGSIEHDALIGQPLGRTVYTQHGYAYLALEPSTNDLIQELPRTTQIIYGKDAAQIALRLNVYPGRRVVEAGTGSGGSDAAPGAGSHAGGAHLQLRDPAGHVRHSPEQPGRAGPVFLRDAIQ